MNKIHIISDFDKVLPDIKDFEWIDCDVGFAGRAYDFDSRTCKKCVLDWTNMFDLTDIFRLWNFNNIKFEKTEVLRYDVGCFFKSHLDTLHNPHHVGTLLIIFPTDDIEGGNLTIDNKHKRCDEDSSDLLVVACKAPHIVYIPLGTFHEVDKLNAGSRIVFKAAICCNDYNYEIVEQMGKKFEMEPEKRIIINTGKRYPTQEEVSKLSSGRLIGMKRRNMYLSALNLPTLKD